ncbi:tannase/feruloyl esterase family alpha/beta hydrolase [Duganella sp. BuS-21]|uniref:tannase/feruloyl esterase family alpha/beta hydrolase n=1 Tax=Duganella sp. BuS-21 TaxID=2943848 RepID=UPI0035A58F4D
MPRINFLFRLMIALLLTSGAMAHASAQTGAERCAALPSAQLAMPAEAPTRIIKAELVAAAGTQPALCLVSGVVAPAVNFTLALPLEGWNEKFFQHGCGGSCGTARQYYCEQPLSRGYACISTDMGHSGPSREWIWGRDQQALVDFAFRSTHVTALVGKALVAGFYQDQPKKSYFYGCSTGGRQAMVEAERFPDDFDGIIAGGPIINQTGAAMQLLWTTLANRDRDNREIVKEADVRRLHAAVLRQCDAKDGLRDGQLADPRSCDFDPAVLQCPAAQADQCLSPDQVAVVRKIYAGPHDSQGKPLYTGGLALGSELNWLGAFVSADGKPSTDLGGEFMRHIGLAASVGPDWQAKQFDFDRDPQRFGLVEPYFSGSNPDLRKFKARGGKLIGFQGWNDPQIVPLNFLDFYQTVTRTMGGPQQTRDFFRLFMLPGTNHCTNDGVGADAIDYLDALEQWVEQGKAPEVLIGSHIERSAPQRAAIAFPLPVGTKIGFTRPHYAYPGVARYKGKGDPNDAASFEAAPAKP